ncbi:hypothetical protein [Leptolyngbya sp. FACHB-1624]|nr:hypothetical protein [Leptolyngbya sp. FACHB-1624]
MKRFLLTAFSLMLVSTTSTVPASAQPRINQEIASNNLGTTQTTVRLSPADLAHFAYRGYFKSQSINGYGSLIQDHNTGKVSAKDIVQAAVNTHHLPASTLDDRGYLNAVDNQLRDLNLH